jgi:predicted MFS family arabinose efflux permease
MLVSASRPHLAVEVTFFFTSFVASTYAFGVYLFATMAPDLQRAFGFGPEGVGLATGLGQAGLMVFALVSGALAPRIGALLLILLAVALSSLCLLALASISSQVAMMALLTVLGACAATVWVPIVAVTQEVIPHRHHGKALGLMSSGTSFGLLLNGVMVPPLLALGGWRLVWVVVALLSASLCALASWRLRKLITRPSTPSSPSARAADRGRLIWREIAAPVPMLVTAILFLSGLCLVPFQTYLTSFLRDGLGWSVAAATISWSALGLGGMAGGIALGSLADLISVKRALALCYLLSLLASLAVLFRASPALTYVALTAFGMSYYAIFGLVAAYIARCFAAAIVSGLSAITFVAVGGGGMIGNYLGGLLLAATGNYHLLYVCIAVGVALLLIAALILPRDVTRPIAVPS